MHPDFRKKVSLRNPVHFLALGFGSGLANKAPGTMGTIAAIPVTALMLAWLSTPLYLVVTLLVCLVGVGLCSKTANDLAVHDHPGIVWDEVAGYMITLIAVPLSWQNLLAGFALFRIFDILKPWPISYLDRNVHGGLGIMLDDILAGVMSLAVMQILLHYQLLV